MWHVVLEHGEHNMEIYQSSLGLGDPEIDQFAEQYDRMLPGMPDVVLHVVNQEAYDSYYAEYTDHETTGDIVYHTRINGRWQTVVEPRRDSEKRM